MDDLDTIKENIERYQSCDCVHPLTCGIDSCHSLLRPEILSKGPTRIILVCPDCEYTQPWIPDFVSTFTEEVAELMRNSFRLSN